MQLMLLTDYCASYSSSYRFFFIRLQNVYVSLFELSIAAETVEIFPLDAVSLL